VTGFDWWVQDFDWWEQGTTQMLHNVQHLGTPPNVAQRATFGWVNDKQRKPKGFGALLGFWSGKFNW